MSYDCGFDIHPRLEAIIGNKQTYQPFLEEIIITYNDVYDKDARRPDGKVLEMPIDSEHFKDCITFMVGECSDIPSNSDKCDCFLRFSSKISGHLTAAAEPYIRNVYKITKKYFGSSVHFWHEMNEPEDERQWGCYDWQELQDAEEKLREVETGQEGDFQSRALEESKETTSGPSGSHVTNSNSRVA